MSSIKEDLKAKEAIKEAAQRKRGLVFSTRGAFLRN